ncbi:MAG: PKD-like domain-containing protein, partial [Cyclobacteriaceae bacterium]
MAKRITKHFLILTFLFLALGASKAIAGPTYTITSVIDECNNLSNGSFDIVVSAASGPNLRIIVFGPGSFADIDTGNFPMPALPFTFNVTGAPNGSYTVIVRDGSGPTIKLQDIVNYPSLSISGQIVTDNTVCGNSAGAIDITVAGGSGVISNYRYLWSNGATTQDVSGLASGSYSVTITDIQSACTLNPSFFVNDPQPLNFSIATSTPSICNGGNINISVGTPLASNPAENGVAYQLRVNGSNVLGSQVGDGVSPITFSLPTSSYISGQTIDVSATLPPCLPKLSGNTLSVVVNPTPVLVAGQSKTICSGDNAAYEILLAPLNLPLGTTFSWPDPDGAGPATAGTNVAMGVAGTTHINDVLTIGTTTTTITYVVTPTTGSCPGIPQNVSITVNPTPVLVAGQSKTICPGDNTAYEILLTPLNLPLGTTFSWPDPDGAGPATAGTNVAMGVAGTTHINDVLTNATTAAITITYVVTPTTGSCPGTPQNVVITVSPTPVLVAGQSKTICSGDNTAYEILLTPLNLPLGTTFSWPDPDGAGPATAGTNVAMGVAGTTHINDVLTTGTTSSTVTYVVTPSVGTCAGLPQNITITINPKPVLVVGQSKTICSGDNTAYEILLTPLNLPLGTTFSWPDPDGAGPATAGTNVAMGVAGTTHINDVLTNTTTAVITITYVVTPTTGSCPGIPQNVSITVSPTPVLVVGQSNT